MKFFESFKIIIPVKNNVQYTKQCLDSLFECTKTPFELIIVDDGSTDETPAVIADYRERFKNIRYIRFLESHGVTFCWNRGLESCDLRRDIVAIINNDVVFTDGWDIPLIQKIIEGASISCPYYTSGEMPTDFPTGIQRHESGWKISGWCFVCRPNLFNETGTFPEELILWSQDRWVVSATDKIGGEMVWTAESYIHHYESRTISITPNLVQITNNDAVVYDKICEEKSYKRF